MRAREFPVSVEQVSLGTVSSGTAETELNHVLPSYSHWVDQVAVISDRPPHKVQWFQTTQFMFQLPTYEHHTLVKHFCLYLTNADEVSILLNITGGSSREKEMDNHTLDLSDSAQNGYMSFLLRTHLPK